MKVKLMSYIPLSVCVFAGRTAWESYSRGRVYNIPTDKIIKNDYNFLDSLMNKLKHWSVMEHVWYNFIIEFSSAEEMYKTLAYVKNEYNFYSILSENKILFSVNLRTILEEIKEHFDNNCIVKEFYRRIKENLPYVHKALLNRKKFEELDFNFKENISFEKKTAQNSLGHKVTLLMYLAEDSKESLFKRRDHIFYTLYIENFSRALLQEIVRHDDIVAMTIKSSRYTLKELKELERITEDEVSRFLVSPNKEEIKKIQLEELKYVKNMLEQGYKNDEVKYILPEGYRTKGVFTYNIKNLKNLIALRTESPTKVLWEFYELAKLIKKVTDKTISQ